MKRSFFGVFFTYVFMCISLIFVGIILPTRVFAAPPQIPTTGCFLLGRYFDVLSDANDMVCYKETGNLGFSLDFDYGTVSGTGICSSVGSLDGSGSIGNPSVGTGQYCWCSLTGFNDGKYTSLTGHSTYAIFIDNFNSRQECNEMCGCLCAETLAGTPEMRDQLYSAKNEFCIGAGICDTLLDIDSNFCTYSVSSGRATTGMNWTAGLTGGKSVTGTSLCSTTSGTSTGDSGTPNESGDGSECWCRLTGYNDGTNQYNATNSTWFYYGDEWGNNADCADSCPALCAKTLFPDYLCNMAGGEFCVETSSASYDVRYSCGTHGTGSPTDSNSPYADGLTVTTLAGNVCTADTGYDFNGWLCDNNVGTVSAGGIFTMPASNVICTAQWEQNNYTVSFEKGDQGGLLYVTGATSSLTNKHYGDTITLPASGFDAPTGYHFNSWLCDNGIGTKAVGATFTMPASNVICTAQWTANQTTVNYACGADTGGSVPNSNTATYGSNFIFATNSCTKTGYYFDGWSCPGLNGVQTAGGAGSTWSYTGAHGGSLTCTAQWAGNQTTVNYVCGADTGGSVPNSNTATYGSNFIFATNSCTKTGYYFDGWSCPGLNGVQTAGGAGSTWSYTGAHGESLTCTAQWAAKTSEITYDCNGGTIKSGQSGNMTTTFTYDQSYSLTSPSTLCERTGYSLISSGTNIIAGGWICENTSTRPSNYISSASGTWSSEHNVYTCTAQWSQDYYKITYICPNGIMSTETAPMWTYGQTASINSFTCGTAQQDGNPGYNFIGWYCDGGNTLLNSGDTITMNHNVTCISQWSPITYRIMYTIGTPGTLVSCSNDTTASTTATMGQSATLATNNFSCPRLVFAGWRCQDANQTIDVVYGSGQTVNPWSHPANLTCAAQWATSTTQYTLSYSCGNGVSGTPPASENYLYDQLYTLIDNPGSCAGANGMQFNGWSCNNGLTAPSGAYNVELNSVCTAQWAAQDVDLKWFGENGVQLSNADSMDCTYGNNITLIPNAPVKPGYHFTRWNVMQNPLSSLNVNVTATSVMANNVSNGNNVCVYGSGGTNPDITIDCNNAMVSDLNSYEWKDVFSYGTVYGLARCSTVPHIAEHITGNPYTTNGRFCWCRAIGYKPTNGLLQSIPVSAWINPAGSPGGSADYPTTAECQAECAGYCAGKVGAYPGTRTVLYEQQSSQ